MKKITSMTAAGALAVTLIGITAPTSSAAFTTRCVGEGGAVTIPGDLVVPAGQSCVLTGTTVQGNVRVQRGADLVVADGTFQGNVNVAENGYLDMTTTSVAGNLTAREGFGTNLTGSSVGGAVASINQEGVYFGFLMVEGSDLGARVRATGGSLDLASTTVATDVLGLQADYTDLRDTVVGGVLRVEGNPLGSMVCDSEVYGNAVYTDNETGVQLGGLAADGGLGDCDGSNYVGGNVTVNGTQGGVWVVDNIIRGNLAGTGNDPAPVGEGNRVRGELRGQFADLGAPAAMGARSTAAVQERGAQERAAAEARQESAEAKAEDAGAAF